jgi:anti-anti-sigma regulatory factor
MASDLLMTGFADHAAPRQPLLSEVVDRATGTIRATGRLTALGADLLRGTVEGLRRLGCARVTVELREVEAADDAARGILLELRHSVTADGGELVLRHLD